MKTWMVDLDFPMARIEAADNGEPMMTICWPSDGDSPAFSGVIAGRPAFLRLIEEMMAAMEDFNPPD